MFCENCKTKVVLFGVTDSGLWKYWCPKCYARSISTKQVPYMLTLQQESEKCVEAITDLCCVVAKELKIPEVLTYVTKKLKKLL